MTDWLHFHFSLSCIGEGNGNPLQCSCLENPRDRGAWWAAVYGVAQSRTWLKRHSAAAATVFTFLSSMKWWHTACTKMGEPTGLPRSLSFNRSSPIYHFLQIPPPARIKASALACYRAQISLHYSNHKSGSTFPWLFSPFLCLISLQVLYIWAPKFILNPSPLFILSVTSLIQVLQHILPDCWNSSWSNLPVSNGACSSLQGS